MPIDREGTLTKAAKYLRQGRLDLAIPEYERVVEDQPHDWNTANTLGDLYVRASQPDRAVAVYERIADHLLAEGFAPKAAGVFKKILKVAPTDDKAHLQLAQISARQGLLAEARSYLNAVLTRCQGRGDTAGVDEVLVRLGGLDPLDFAARLSAAGAIARGGDPLLAAATFREIHDDLLEAGREAEALDALRAARPFLVQGSSGGDRPPALMMALLELEVRDGNVSASRDLVSQLLSLDSGLQQQILSLAASFAGSRLAAATACVDAVADAAAATGDHKGAAAVVRQFAHLGPGRTNALLKLVELCRDAGFESDTYDAQAQLADAYLEFGQAAEARGILEDLASREPWDTVHIDKLRQALLILNVPDVNDVIGRIVNSGSDADVESLRVKASATAHEVAISSELRASEAAPVPQDPPPASMEIDLTSVLTDLRGMEMPGSPPPPPQDLDRVFASIRANAERQEGVDNSAEYMALARTYMEMGLTDEAVAALQNAVTGTACRFEAAAALGKIAADTGDLPAAVEWFERGAEVPAPSVEEGRALLYDLGATLERMGESARALAVFLELQADAGDYRDVTPRVATLARSQTGD
ncbi:MAG: tetratricopeptide repeat protein [Vicinamibacterales bacterium]